VCDGSVRHVSVCHDTRVSVCHDTLVFTHSRVCRRMCVVTRVHVIFLGGWHGTCVIYV